MDPRFNVRLFLQNVFLIASCDAQVHLKQYLTTIPAAKSKPFGMATSKRETLQSSPTNQLFNLRHRARGGIR